MIKKFTNPYYKDSDFENDLLSVRSDNIMTSTMIKDYQFIVTGSHGYLVIPKQDKNYKIASDIFSQYDYKGNLAIYLEEDCQAGKFINLVYED